MAKKKKKTQLSSEGKTELAKAIAEKSQNFAKTYANVENQVARFFRWLSGWLDKLLFNQKHGKIVALVLALFFYFMISSGQELLDTSRNYKVLGNYSIQPRISTQIYEISELPEVEVSAVGDISDIKNMKQQQNIKVIADLTGLTEGTHNVNLEVENAPNRVEIVLNPSSVAVTIKKTSIRSFSLGYDFVNRSLMDNTYDLSEPVLEEGSVTVRASKDTLDKISYVKALIEVNTETKEDFEETATIAAYDENGEKMTNVNIIPATMKASVKVTKPSKDVPITLVPTGIVPDNKAIESYEMDHKTVTLYGKQEILDKISELPITIPASTLTSDREINMPLPMLNGVSKTSINVVNMTIKLAALKDKEVKNVPIEIRNGRDGLTYRIVSDSTSSSQSEVTVKGAEKVIEEIGKDDISVYVDVSKLDKEGTFKEMSLTVEGKNKLATYELKNASVTIQVSGTADK